MRDRASASRTPNVPQGGAWARSGLALVACAAMVAVVGCGAKPSAVNIELRKKNEALASEIANLKTDLAARDSKIQSFEASIPTVPTLPSERLNELYTAHGLVLGRLTGGADLDPEKPGVDALKIYVVPIDASGDELKAAGTFKVEAFDLAAADPRVGMWEFSVEESKAHWNGSGLLYEYVLPCPFETLPAHNEITVKVTFTDALTQRQIVEQKIVKLRS